MKIFIYVLTVFNFLFCLSLTRFSPFGFQLWTSWPVAIPFVTFFVLLIIVVNYLFAKSNKKKKSEVKVFFRSCLTYILIVILVLSIFLMSFHLTKKVEFQDGEDKVVLHWGGGPIHSGCLVLEHKFWGIYLIKHRWDEDDDEFDYYDEKAQELGFSPFDY